MVVVGDRVIGSFAVLSRGALDELLDHIVRREPKTLHSSSFLVLVWCFFSWVLELMVILVTSSSSSKTEFTHIFYDVFVVGGYDGSS